MKSIEPLMKQLKALPFFADAKYVKYRMFFVPLVVLTLAIVISVLVTIPQLLKLFNTFKTIDELNLKKVNYQKKAVELEALKLEDYRQDLDTALVALPVNKDIPGVMGEILISLGGSGMTLDGISFSASPGESEKAEEFAITINAVGTETSLRNFLERITLTPRLIKLTSIRVDRGSADTLAVEVVFATFYQQLPVSIGSIDEALPTVSGNDTQILADIEAKLRQFPKVSEQTPQSTTGKLDPFRP